MNYKIKNNDRKYNHIIILSLFVLLIIIFIFSFCLGRFYIPIKELYNTIINHFIHKEIVNQTLDKIIFNIRLPRIIIAIMVGTSLSVAGCVYQGIFQNPMASPDILGASNGAAFGAALAILFHLSNTGITILAFVMSFISVIIVYIIGDRSPGRRVVNLILSGIMIGSIFTSLTSYIKLVLDPSNELPAITYWLMGSLQASSMNEVKFIIIPIASSLLILFLIRYRLNLLSLGDEEAKSLGINVNLMRLVTILLATLLSAASVSVSGMIGFVGLVIPHLARKIVGNNYIHLLPTSMILGGAFLLLIDNVSRNLMETEIPIGILTSLIGAPFFLYLIFRKEGRECSM
ncbi:MAG: iron ABC transporter permease [Eubacteriales bacterium]|nr:iron ABC transporter permease [Eubacteriales bacterium]